MAPVGQEPGPAMIELATRFIEQGHRHRLAPRGGDAVDRIADVGSEDDGPLLVPGSAAGDGGLAEGPRRPSLRLDPLELGVGEEPDGAAVR